MSACGIASLAPGGGSKPAAQPPMPPTPPAAIAARAPAEPTLVEPPARMTSAQQAGFDTWLIKTYLACWKPARQPADADVYVAQMRLAYNPTARCRRRSLSIRPQIRLKPQAIASLPR